MGKLIKDTSILILALLMTSGMAYAMQPPKVIESVRESTKPKVVEVAPEPVKPAEPVPTPTPEPAPVVAVPAPPPVVYSGDCASELRKYNWNQTVAYNVMMAESGNNPYNVNNNPSTGDYSVGCFQINLYGANARTRPSEAWLKNAANNVSYAYGMWSRQGWSPWGACRKVACY